MQASSEPIFPVLDIVSPVDICSSESVVPSSESLLDTPEVSSQHIPIPPPTTAPIPVIQSLIPAVSSRRLGRPSRPPLWLQDFVTKPKTNTCLYPLATHLTYPHLSPSYRHALHAYSSISEPTSF
ncbi:hypothetical protein KY289_036035 [Solanum tuberosum]|nr:hypothetical protein KY289_036035 [Solanum tuberosum]